jgi:malate dehydrogenase
MVEAILKDQRRILPAIAYLEGEYGFNGIYLGVPTILGGNGLEKVIELELTEEEKKALEKSADSVKRVMAVLA